MTVSAPHFSDTVSFSTSSASDELVGELPMFELILTRAFRPIAIGSSAPWLTFAGMIMRPRATSSRTSSAGSSSRCPTRSISGDTMPWRARCICVLHCASGSNVLRCSTTITTPSAGMIQIRLDGSVPCGTLSAPSSGLPWDRRERAPAHQSSKQGYSDPQSWARARRRTSAAYHPSGRGGSVGSDQRTSAISTGSACTSRLARSIVKKVTRLLRY